MLRELDAGDALLYRSADELERAYEPRTVGQHESRVAHDAPVVRVGAAAQRGERVGRDDDVRRALVLYPVLHARERVVERDVVDRDSPEPRLAPLVVHAAALVLERVENPDHPEYSGDRAEQAEEVRRAELYRRH